jgi:hypothetical protein
MSKRLTNYAYAVFELFASLELAVFIILALAVILATGTVYESKYGAAVASREVYRSIWMQILLWVFMLNLAAAALSRLPWRRHHIGFLVTHLGIITLLLGSWLTQRAGVDGSLILGPGEQGRTARIDENMLYVFRAVAGRAYDLVLNQKLDFDPRHPRSKPLPFPFHDAGGDHTLTVVRYIARAAREVRAEDAVGGMPALKFQFTGSRATFSDWLFLQADVGAVRQVGPATFRFTAKKPDLSVKAKGATVLLYLDGDPKLPPRLAVAHAGAAFEEKGRLVPGKAVSLGLMDFKFVPEEYHPAALPKAEYFPLADDASPAAEGSEVVELSLTNAGGAAPASANNLWLELGSSGQVPLGDALYYVQYAKREVGFGFDLKLTDFHIGYYEGTNKPMTYSSDVEFEGHKQTISMNEPLHHNGYTFYQSSYESDENGEPKFSVFSVNYDPGRWVKYLGSLMTVLGIVSMFYFKPVYSGKSKWLKKESAA